MITSSAASLPHSEAVASSVALSSSAFSSLASSLDRRCTNRSQRTSGAPPLRSADVTEKPHDASDTSAVASSSGSECAWDSDQHHHHRHCHNYQSSSRRTSLRSSGAHQNLMHQLADHRDSPDNAEHQREAENDAFTETTGPAVEEEMQNTAATTAAARTSTMPTASATSPPPLSSHHATVNTAGSSSLSLPPRAVSVGAGDSFFSRDDSPEALLAGLSPRLLESGLQLYVDHGGTHVHEVSPLLKTLPWCSAAAAQAAFAYLQRTSGSSHAFSTMTTTSSPSDNVSSGDDGAGSLSPLLDPETWLCAVAVAASARGEGSTDLGEVVAASSQSLIASNGADTAGVPHDAKDRYTSSFSEHSSGGVSSSRRDMSSTASKTKDPFAMPSAAGVQREPLLLPSPHHQQQQQKEDWSCHHPTSDMAPTSRSPTKRKLAFEEEGTKNGASSSSSSRLTHLQRRASLSELPPRPPSSSLRSLLSQPAPLLPSPQAPASSRLSEPEAKAPKPSSSSSSSSCSGGTGTARRPPRSSPPISSPTYSSVSSEPQHLDRNPQQLPPFATLSSSTRSDGPSSVITAAVLEEEAGMRSLFQHCLCTPLAVATSMLSENDWVMLIEELRSEGHHKLPPQALLDDVTNTIAEETLHSKCGAGLNLAGFAHILHRELDEVRRDLTHFSLPAAASEVSTGRCFPAHPNYLVALPSPGAATSAVSPAAHPTRASLSLLSGLAGTSGDRSGRRVLPTWSMALAGLFPLAMSSVCPVPVVRYLRSVGLMNAVLEALVQRLEMEVAAMPEAPAAEWSLAKAPQGSRPVTGFQEPQHDVAASTTPVLSPPAAVAVVLPDPIGVSDFVWPPPRANSLTSFSMNGGNGSSCVRPTSSVVATSESHDDIGVPWQENPEWRSADVKAETASRSRGPLGKASSSNSAVLIDANGFSVPLTARQAEGTGDQVAPSARGRPLSSAAVSRQSSVSRRYLDERPLDEISASVIARAKARRLMDSLRRNTVPINRYECFARVEHEDETVQEPLCFISKEELKKTLGDSDDDDDGGGGDGASQDSDALSDIVAMLTYDPAAAAAEASEKEGRETQGDATPPAGRRSVAYVDQRRTSARPPQLPRGSVAQLLPNVFSGSTTRASVLLLQQRARRATSCPGDGAADDGRAPISGGPRASFGAAAALGVTKIPQRPLPPPPPVPGMYRMAGVLLGALPKRQEAALVERLSHPLCDPRTMGLRAQSAGVRPHRTSPPHKVGARPASSPFPFKEPLVPPHLDEVHAINDTANSGRGPTATSRKHTLPTPSSLSRLTKEQSRSFHLFHVPPVLVADPLSTVAAATAMTQVLSTKATPHTPAGGPPPHSFKTPPKPRPPQKAAGPSPPSHHHRRQRKSSRRSAEMRTLPEAASTTHETCGRGSAARPAAVARGNFAAPRRTPARSGTHERRQPRAEPTCLQENRNNRVFTDAETGAAATQVAAHRLYDSVKGQGVATAYASEVPRVHRPSDSEGCETDKQAQWTAAGDTCAPVWYAADHGGADALEGQQTATDGAPPHRRSSPLPMSLYERRLLRLLQRAYTAERAAE